jgi:anti-sigma factor (TIGR02949 family)
MNSPSPLTCQQTFERLADYLDRELSPVEVARVEEHLAVCEVCAREYRFEGTVLRCLKDKLRRIAAPPQLLDRIRQALDQARAE